eukprot:10495166-Karenia_brevis.AAC.1
MDATDFYMSGSHEVLCRTCMDFMDFDNDQSWPAVLADFKYVYDDLDSVPLDAQVSRVKMAFQEILHTILANQFVQPKNSDRVWRVVLGSGMGVQCSGEIADCCLHQAELMFFEKLGHHHDLRSYLRYKDDILIIIGGDVITRKSFCDKSKAAAAPVFVLEVESVSSKCINFLDISISKSVSSGGLNITVYVKPTSLWTPLSDSSMHTYAVHNAWPRQMVHRYRRLCSNSKLAKPFIDHFNACLKARCQKHPGLETPKRQRKPQSKSDVHSTLVLPGYQAWSNAGLNKC